MLEDVITAENVEKLRALGIYWKYSSCHPESNTIEQTKKRKLWLRFNNQWYCYYTTNLGRLIYDFLHCRNETDVNDTINKIFINQ
jgi:hypothetical protein